MSWILRAVKKCCSFARVSRGVQHVSFSASTVNLQRERTMRNIASPIPFQNFLNELRLTALDEYGKDRMTMRESSMMRKSGVRLWSLLSDEQKDKYRQLAVNAFDTRLPLRMLSDKKSTPFLSLENPSQTAQSEAYADWRRQRRTLSEGQVDRRAPKRRTKLVKRTKKSTKAKNLKNPIRKIFKKPLPRSKTASVPTQRDVPVQEELSTTAQPSRQSSRLQSRKRKHSSSATVKDSDTENTQNELALPELNDLATEPGPHAEVANVAKEAAPLYRESKRRRMSKPSAD